MNGKQYKCRLVLLVCPNLARFDSRSVFDEIQNREPAKSVPNWNATHSVQIRYIRRFLDDRDFLEVETRMIPSLSA